MKSPVKRASLVRCLSLVLPAVIVPLFLMEATVLARGITMTPATTRVTSRIVGDAAQQGDPCTLRPGSVVTTTFQISNASADTEAAIATATLPPGLVALPNTCTATPPAVSCGPVSAQSVAYSGVLGPGQVATVTFKSQVADATPPGTELCIVINRTVSDNPVFDPINSCVTVDCPQAGPGLLATGIQESNDQLPGSVLIYNLYTSNGASPNTQNTQFSVTNIEPINAIAIHMFFVDGSSCNVSDRFLCLTPNQTHAFSATDMDPGVTGYLVMVATDLQTGCPINFNYLIGDAYVKFADGRAANLPAEGVAALAGGLPECDSLSFAATLAFDGVGYARLGAVLASDSIPSAVEGNSTMLVINRLGGNLQTGPGRVGNIFGVLYDDGEGPHSFGIASNNCQFRGILSNALPRTTPNFEATIPAGHTGWMKFWREPEGAISGALINVNAFVATSGSAFDQGRNLHKLRLQSSETMTIPVFPPGC